MQDGGERGAARAFDSVLEQLEQIKASAGRYPLQLRVRLGVMLSSGRSHFADGNLEKAYVRFTDVKRSAPASHPDVASGTVDQILSRIAVELGLPDDDVDVHFQAWAKAAPSSVEAQYDYAMWRVKKSLPRGSPRVTQRAPERAPISVSMKWWPGAPLRL